MCGKNNFKLIIEDFLIESLTVYNDNIVNRYYII